MLSVKIAELKFTGGLYLHFGQRRQQQAQGYVRVVAFHEASQQEAGQGLL
jgi:hypothetical protein